MSNCGRQPADVYDDEAMAIILSVMKLCSICIIIPPGI